MDQSAWAKELLAQSRARTVEELWDAINAATNKLGLAADFPVGEVRLGQWDTPEALLDGIELRVSRGGGPILNGRDWRRWIQELDRAGWQLAQVEFRHRRFEQQASDDPGRSLWYFSAHLVNESRAERVALQGDLVVDWGRAQPGQALAPVERVDAGELIIQTRRGPAPFQLVLDERIIPPPRAYAIDPLIVHDLDHDGHSEIILPAVNRIYRPGGSNQYASEPLCAHPSGLILAAILADFDGDGAADLLCARFEGLFLFRGSGQGTFDQPGVLTWLPDEPLVNPMALTCGDVDGDGDLDVFLGQYKVPTLGQILRPRYYDANDGHPAFLLRNDGQGMFTDVTESSGLEAKRWRRVYSASFVDWDVDGDQDLLVVSDFAGADFHRNEGAGRFVDRTAEWLGESHAFGMAHTLADFDVDGRLDLLMIGMNSPTADRLDHLGLWRPDATEDRGMRARMTVGNRLYLGGSREGRDPAWLGDSIARSGWSWGCSAFDFNNDGFPDVYIANGHESKKTVQDYEPEFWLHDIYIDESVDDAAATTYFTEKYGRTRGQGWSYGGYEKNRLYLNRAAGSFVEAGHVLGVALEQDSRCVVADDLDGDGRPDLLVTTLEVWPESKHTLKIYRNTLENGRNWIGFRFRNEPGGPSPVGARVSLRHGDQHIIRHIVTGDSFRSQHAGTIHFGLGGAKRVDSAEIHWPGGRSVTLREPALNRYHSIPTLVSPP